MDMIYNHHIGERYQQRHLWLWISLLEHGFAQPKSTNYDVHAAKMNICDEGVIDDIVHLCNVSHNFMTLTFIAANLLIGMNEHQ